MQNESNGGICGIHKSESLTIRKIGGLGLQMMGEKHGRRSGERIAV